MELYPGITLQQHGERYSINIEVMTNHGKGMVSFDLVKQMPEIQEAINKRCADILITPIIDWKKECEELKDKVGILEQDIKAKQMVIDNMNLNYTTQEAKIKQLQRDLANAKKTGSGLFGWMRR